MEKENIGGKLVASAMLGLDGESAIVGGKCYYIKPPSIKKIVGCAHYLMGFGNEESIGDYIRKLNNLDDTCKSASFIITGDESLTEELKNGTLDEVINAIELGIGLIGTKNFIKLSVLSRNVSGLIARQ